MSYDVSWSDPDVACDHVAQAGMSIVDSPEGEIYGMLAQPGRLLRYRLHRRPDGRYVWLQLEERVAPGWWAA